MPGFTPVRTARIIAMLIALSGMVLLFIERVLDAVLEMAKEGVALGLARYDSLTGRMAVQTFIEDQKLLALLKQVNQLLPTADFALTVLQIMAAVLLALSLFGIAFPKPFAHLLVALKLLKWAPSEESATGAGTSESMRATLKQLGEVPLKKLVVPVVILLIITAAVAIVHSCSMREKGVLHEGEIGEMQRRALDYIVAQKKFFAKNNSIGSAKDLNLPDSSKSETFMYKITPTKFVAYSTKDMEACPAGSRWSVIASTKGLFNKELTLLRVPPKDEACANLSPDFKKLGKKKSKQKQEKK